MAWEPQIRASLKGKEGIRRYRVALLNDSNQRKALDARGKTSSCLSHGSVTNINYLPFPLTASSL